MPQTRLHAIRLISELHASRVKEARHELGSADTRLRDAEDRMRAEILGRNEALESWHTAFSDHRPDPDRISRLGEWVNMREDRVRSAKSHRETVQQQRDGKVEILSQRTALHKISAELSARLHRQANKAADEIRQLAAEDLHRSRRHKCRSL
jgi:hypothetical protein